MLIDVTIKGTNTLLLHKYSTASVSKPKSRSTVKDSKNYADEWKTGTYLDKDAQAIMPWANLMACMFDGAKSKKSGKVSLTRILYTSIYIAKPENLILFDKEPITLKRIEDNDWLHINGAVVSGRRIDRVRTAIPKGYEISFQIGTKPDGNLNEADIRLILEDAGKIAGLGDWRPSAPKKPGPYGTFEIVKFEAKE